MTTTTDDLTVQVERLQPKPGDLLVVRVPHLDETIHIHDALVEAIPDGVRALIVEHGVDIELHAATT